MFGMQNTLTPTSFRRWLAPIFFVVLALQPLWHFWLAPPRKAAPLFVTLLFVVPLLPAAIGYLSRWRLANVLAAMLLLGYFIVGAMQSADLRHRLPALMQAALCVLFYLLWLAAVLGEKRAAKLAAGLVQSVD